MKKSNSAILVVGAVVKQGRRLKAMLYACPLPEALRRQLGAFGSLRAHSMALGAHVAGAALAAGAFSLAQACAQPKAPRFS